MVLPNFKEQNRAEIYLDRFAEGKSHDIGLLLDILAEELIFVPVFSWTNNTDRRGTQKVKVVTLVEEGRHFIPIFTSEDYFLTWSRERFHCLPLACGDLIVSLPIHIGLQLNLGSNTSLELTPDDLEPWKELEIEDQYSYTSSLGHSYRTEDNVIYLYPHKDEARDPVDYEDSEEEKTPIEQDFFLAPDAQPHGGQHDELNWVLGDLDTLIDTTGKRATHLDLFPKKNSFLKIFGA